MTAEAGRRRPVHVIESGPAAGVIATAALARRIGLGNAISIDMGGTTAKASVIEGGEIKRTGEFEIGGSMSQGSRLYKGGGYRAARARHRHRRGGRGRRQHRERGRGGGAPRRPAQRGGGAGAGVLRPRGQGGDAHRRQRVPRLSASRSGCRAGCASTPTRAARALAEQVAARLDIGLLEAAHGVYLLGCAGMARAVRAVTIERGRDPQEFTLVAFGGNGPLFAAEMARSLEIATVLVPPAPGVWSALGLLEAEMEHHLVRTFLRPLAGLGARRAGGGRGRARGRGRRAARRPGPSRRRDRARRRPQVPGPVVRADGAAAPGGERRRCGRGTSRRPSPASTSAPTATRRRAIRSRWST